LFEVHSEDKNKNASQEEKNQETAMSLFENSCVFKGLKYYNHRGIQPNSTLLKIKHSFNSEPNTHHNNPGGSSFPLFTEAELPRIEQD
jgi:hypothetical protein